MRYLIPIKLVQQCMKHLGGLYNVCIYYHLKCPRSVATLVNSIDCILVQNGTLCANKWSTYCYSSSILCICNCVTWWIILTCKLFFFDFIVLESVLYIGEPFIASSKMSLQRSVGSVSCVIPTVMCDVVILVMCAMYWVLQFVYWFCHCYVTQSVKNHLFIFIWDITIKVNAYGCRPENGRIPLIVQWYTLVHFMMTLIVLIIYAYLNLFNFVTSLGEHCTHFCRFIRHG